MSLVPRRIEYHTRPRAKALSPFAEGAPVIERGQAGTARRYVGVDEASALDGVAAKKEPAGANVVSMRVRREK